MRVVKNIIIMTIVLLLIYIAPGCTNIKKNSNGETGNNLNIETSLNEIRIIMHPEYAKYLENTKDWEKYINDKFNIDINVSVLPLRSADDKFTLNSFKEDMDANTLYGLIDVHDSLTLKALITNNLAVPLNSYLENNAVWNSLNENFRKSFCDYKGDIWAIPSGMQSRYYGRLIRTEWLDKEDALPKNVQELIDIFFKFANSDPDNNKLDDTYGAVVGPDYVLGFYDIFAANHCIYNINTSSSCAYNPYIMKFEDAAMKDENLTALNQIIYLFDNKLAYENDYSDNTCNIYKNYPKAGSAFATLRDTETEYYKKIITDFEMTNSETKLKNIMSSICRGYSLTANTPNKESMVNSFINTFYGSNDGYCSGAFGIEGTNYKIEGSILAVADINKHLPISVIYPIPDFEHLLHPIYLLENGKINMEKQAYHFKEKIKPDYENIYVDNAFFDESFDYIQVAEEKRIGGRINYGLFIYESIKAGLSAEEIHLEYSSLAKKAGTDLLIEEWNSKLSNYN